MTQVSPFADVVVLIPAYNPDEKLIAVVNDLVQDGCTSIVIVNDGSGADHRPIFDVLDKIDSVSLCEHTSNMGKGAALKTGFGFVQENFPDVAGVITADADGQHLTKDIRNIAAAASRSPDDILLGCRTFTKGTPLRSWLGNRATAFFLSFVHGISLTDTQTGLRYLPSQTLSAFTTLPGDGYEFELECLIKANERGYELTQIPISTVYIDENASSHFLPIVDSVRIYNVLFRFGGSSLFCFGVDIALFALVFWSGKSVMFATVVARTISGIVNFSINKSLVFRQRHTGNMLHEALGYFALWLVLMLISGIGVSVAADRPTIIVVSMKILIDVSLFLLSYFVQSRFVFAGKR